ncbi:hypothetical protein OG413_36630 [Streptomyces sp. NBC_01433]|uniref:hypothetical protein n=1 Tax=Streptomyces sp. NBC_01433 TaxID=2903864 RepID=UPI0022516392|nr:hypothetical protein [Streptomyces sp. NBC_01433]MCX4680742.1 hypothetical protein [Streptomyces sp. NBC_01433]
MIRPQPIRLPLIRLPVNRPQPNRLPLIRLPLTTDHRTVPSSSRTRPDVKETQV